jgi:hypothetical protein
VANQRERAERAKERAVEAHKESHARERLEELVSRFCRYPTGDERVEKLRYQLLTGWGGTLADAEGFDHAVFAVHEFRTDERPEDRSEHNRGELDRFADVVLRCELPDRKPPWCIRVPDVEGVDAKLYVAHVVTDLRRARLQNGRLPWLERAIPETESFCESLERDAEKERAMGRFGTSDYDFEIDLNRQAEMARKTLAMLEDERQSIRARAALREQRRATEPDS